MNELETISAANLPALRTDEVKACVDLVGDAIQSAKAKLSAAKHIGADKMIIDEMTAQINDYSALKLRAEMELGKRTAQMERNTEFHGNRYSSDVNTDYNTKKGEQLAEIGVTRQQASAYERMAKNEQEVENYIVETVAQGKAPTRRGAMEKIKPQEFRRTSRVFLPSERPQKHPVTEIVINRATGEVEYTLDDLLVEMRAINDDFIQKYERIFEIRKDMIAENANAVKAVFDELISRYAKIKEGF